MKKILLFLLFFALVISCKKKEVIVPNTPKAFDGYFVKGTYKTEDNTIVYLQEKINKNTYKTLKTSQVFNNQFTFTNKLDMPKLLYIGFEDITEKVPFIANNFETFIDINTANFEQSKIIGSSIQNVYTTYLFNLQQAKNKFSFKLKYIKNNPNSLISASILREMLGKTKWRLGQNKKGYNYLSQEIKNSAIGKEINTFITKNTPLVKKEKSIAEVSLDPEISDVIVLPVYKKKATAVITPYRKKAPNFYAESINGNDVSLKSMTKNAKVTLIDFWASWCGPCRKQNPHLIRLYKKYRSKGFVVIGVSEDRYVDIDKWKNAIIEDQLPWNQIIDDNRRIGNMFGVTGVPHNVLLDQNHGIIFTKKSSYTVERKLKEIFGY